MNRVYQSIKKIPREQCEEYLKTGDSSDSIEALLSIVFYDPDWDYALEKCLEYSSDNNKDIAGIATLSLGHLVRIHKKYDKKIISTLERIRKDPDIGFRAEDALDDIRMTFRHVRKT